VTDPTAAIAITGGVIADDPVTVTVTYTDEVALDPATVELSDLVITGVGSYSILAQTLTFAPDNSSATATYSVLQDGGWTTDPVDFDIAAGAITDTSANPNTAANDAFTFDDPGGDVFVFALNAGGGAYTASDGTDYDADTYGVGNSYSVSNGIAGTTDDALYQTEVWQSGGFTYDIAMANGTYRVDMLFAEIYAPLTDPGDRVFDLYLEGALVLDDFDAVAAAGGQYTAYETSTMVDVTDGSLTLTTTSEIENPKISAFSVWIDEDMIA
jgi:hypothetical protein